MRRQALPLPLLLLALPLLLCPGSVRAEGVNLLDQPAETVEAVRGYGVAPVTAGAVAAASRNGLVDSDRRYYIFNPRGRDGSEGRPVIDRPHEGDHEFSGLLDFCGRTSHLWYRDAVATGAAAGAALATSRFFEEYALPRLKRRHDYLRAVLEYVNWIPERDELPLDLTPDLFMTPDREDSGNENEDEDEAPLGGTSECEHVLRLGCLGRSSGDPEVERKLSALWNAASLAPDGTSPNEVMRLINKALQDENRQTVILAIRSKREVQRGLLGRLAVAYRSSTCTVVNASGDVKSTEATAIYVRLFGCSLGSAQSAILYFADRGPVFSLEGNLRDSLGDVQTDLLLDNGQVVIVR